MKQIGKLIKATGFTAKICIQEARNQTIPTYVGHIQLKIWLKKVSFKNHKTENLTPCFRNFVFLFP